MPVSLRDLSIGARAPRGGGVVRAAFGRAGLWLGGWRWEGALPDAPKLVVAFAPHTSNWDFVWGMLAIFALRVRVRWIGKHTIFRAPWGGLMRALGGIPVDRSAPGGLVRQAAGAFAQHDRFWLALAPEGTRSRVERWRSGFYHIAREAGVPIMLAGMDYERRVIHIGLLFEPTGALGDDIAEMRARLQSLPAKRPELA